MTSFLNKIMSCSSATSLKIESTINLIQDNSCSLVSDIIRGYSHVNFFKRLRLSIVLASSHLMAVWEENLFRLCISFAVFSGNIIYDWVRMSFFSANFSINNSVTKLFYDACSLSVQFYLSLKLSHVNDLFQYPLKTENQTFSDIFRGV